MSLREAGKQKRRRQILAAAEELIRESGGIGFSMRELAKRAGSTPFLVLLSAYKVLLARITGQEDVLVGTAMANRTRPEVEAAPPASDGP